MSDKTEHAVQNEPTLTLGDKQYKMSALSERARAQVVNLRVTDQEIARLQQQLAIAQTARGAYLSALLQEVGTAEAGGGEAQDKPA